MVEQGDVSKLPLQLLVGVMTQVDLQERLCSCALVCRTWQAAAVAATSSINLIMPSKPKAKSRTDLFSAWLQRHGQAAVVEHITVSGWDGLDFTLDSGPQLQLPVRQLAAGLRELNLSRVQATFAGGTGDKTSNTAQLPIELSALTRLQLQECGVQLGALSRFKQLQDLIIIPGRQQAAAHESSAPLLAAALSSMQHLSHLQLGAPSANDLVLSSVQHLSRLQVLLLHDCSCTMDALAVAPPSLTRLGVTHLHSKQLTLSPSSTPWLTSLTALRQLEVANASAVQAVVLAGLPRLQHLAITTIPFGAVPEAAAGAAQPPVGWVALTALTDLQHLELRGHWAPFDQAVLYYDDTGTISPAEVAALTASSKLTYLDIRSGLVDAPDYPHMFPTGLQLLLLRELHATMGLLSTDAAVRACVTCCPNLEVVDLSVAIHGESMQYPGLLLEQDSRQYHSVQHLSLLSGLTTLKLHSIQELWDHGALSSLAKVTTLRELCLVTTLREVLFEPVTVDVGCVVAGMDQLTCCRQLTDLRAGLPWEGSNEVEGFHLTNQAPAGSPPDVWCQLPGALLAWLANSEDDMAEVCPCAHHRDCASWA